MFGHSEWIASVIEVIGYWGYRLLRLLAPGAAWRIARARNACFQTVKLTMLFKFIRTTAGKTGYENW